MPNQRAIAAELGLTQATVSMALRKDPSISLETRQKVEETAERLGYKLNPYVASLMSRIRAGKPAPERGSIAVLYDCEKPQDWMGTETFMAQHSGIVKKAADLGFQVDTICVRAPNMVPSRIERMLHARGINGVVLPGSRKSAGENISLRWERYSVAAIAYDWALPWVDRVSTHHRHNVELAFRKVTALGYQRIGMCFPPEGWTGVDSSWRAGFYLANSLLPRSRQIPPFVGKPGETPLSVFRKWLERWKPDALICLIGHEMEYLQQLGLKAPHDIGVACVNRPINSQFAGVSENHHYVGAIVAELVISGILRNDYGKPDHAKLILVEGEWAEGETLRSAER